LLKEVGLKEGALLKKQVVPEKFAIEAQLRKEIKSKNGKDIFRGPGEFEEAGR